VPVDVDHRDQLEQLSVQPVVALDVDLAELEGDPVSAEPEEAGTSLVAEVAAGSAVEGDDAHRGVASQSR
jgi:hypothetical protein